MNLYSTKSSGPKPETNLSYNVEGIVNGVVAKFPGFIQKLLQPYKERLVRNIVKAAEAYVNAKLREYHNLSVKS